jgi:hypothetical protein
MQFVAAARTLTRAARAEGLDAPEFRSPPRLVGVSRSLMRRRAGGAIVAVRLWGRPWAAVLADMVEGVVVINRLEEVPADGCRSVLWEALEDTQSGVAPVAAPRPPAARAGHAA